MYFYSNKTNVFYYRKQYKDTRENITASSAHYTKARITQLVRVQFL